MFIKVAIRVGCLGAALACARTEAASPASGSPSSPAPAPKANPVAVDAAASAPPAAKDPLQQPIAPLTTGKRLRITRLQGIPPLEVVVPKSVKLEMDYLDNEDILPRAELRGGSLNIEVMEPEAGFSSLKSLRGEPDKDLTILRAYETEDGSVWIQKYHQDFSTLVSRPKLKVTCGQSYMKAQADAELVASICLSLRAAK